MPDFTSSQWLLALLAALGIGVSKSGFTGVGLFHVVVFASLFPPLQSTGVVLPMLIVGDLCAVFGFRQHARWEYVRRVLPPALIGVVIGWQLMEWIDEERFKPVIGGIILSLSLLQVARLWRPAWFGDVPHAWWFAWGLGMLAGITTMLANAAGPVMAIYLLAVALPKFELVGTNAWLFLIINVFKIPFSAGQGLITGDTLLFNLVLIPAIIVGILGGRWLILRLPQKLFDSVLLLFAAVMGLRLLLAF